MCKLCDAELEFCCQGIRFLVDSSLLKNTNDDIARFLYKGEGLNKTAIGDYLGERRVKTKGLWHEAPPETRLLPMTSADPFWLSFDAC